MTIAQQDERLIEREVERWLREDEEIRRLNGIIGEAAERERRATTYGQLADARRDIRLADRRLSEIYRCRIETESNRRIEERRNERLRREEEEILILNRIISESHDAEWVEDCKRRLRTIRERRRRESQWPALPDRRSMVIALILAAAFIAVGHSYRLLDPELVRAMAIVIIGFGIVFAATYRRWPSRPSILHPARN